MKLLLFILAIIAPAALLGSSAEAQNYPWCAHYGAGPGGPMNCGFVTLEQCKETVTRTGGSCVRNTHYRPPPGPHAPSRAHEHYPY
jgi:hypothetical protein